MKLALRREERFVLLSLIPTILLIIVFIYYPAIQTFLISLTSRNLRLPGAEKVVWFANYVKLLSLLEFWQVLGRTVLIVILTLPLEILLGFFIALLLNEKFPGRGIARALIILPWMLPPVVNGFLWNWLLNGEYGALNGILYQFGWIKEYQFWLQAPASQIAWTVVVQTWTRFSFPMIIMLAGMQSIPDELYEAAEIDGASWASRLWYITVPMLIPAIAVALTVEFIATFQIFDVVWTLTAGGSAGNIVNPFTKTLMIYNYQIVFRDMKIGLGSSMAYLILVMSSFIGLLFIRNLYNRAVEE